MSCAFGKQEECETIANFAKATSRTKSVAACGESRRKWKCLPVAIDSGACDHVIDPKDIGAYEEFVRDTEASINNENFLAANGEEIPKFGEVKIPVITREKLSEESLSKPRELRRAD